MSKCADFRITEQPGNLRKRQALFLDVLKREASSQLIQDFLEVSALVGQPARQRSRAHGQRRRDRGFVSLSVRQQFLRFVLDRSPQCPSARVALLRCAGR